LKNNHPIWLSPPHLCGKEQQFVQDAMQSNWIAPIGPYLTQFEESIATYTQSQYCVALVSGTSAIHLALKCLKVNAGEVIFCSTFTFIASANPILYENAIPYFIESEANTWNMCPKALEKAILKTIQLQLKPAAIVVVHLYGNPAQMTALIAIATQYNIPIIEDAAEALGSTYHQQACGSLTDIGIISFNGNKIITTSGGGALLTNHEQFAIQTKYLATQARAKTLHYEHTQIGYNYSMSNVVAAIGCGQMTVIDQRVAQRRANFETYSNSFKNFPITFQQEAKDTFANRWLTAVVFEDKTTKNKVQEALLAQQVECRPVWKPLHTQPVFKGALYEGDGFSEKLFEKALCLPSGSNLSEKELQKIVSIVLENLV
jgi:dTDP-4-amino-4,6-dideoxygalactose transaminase